MVLGDSVRRPVNRHRTWLALMAGLMMGVLATGCPDDDGGDDNEPSSDVGDMRRDIPGDPTDQADLEPDVMDVEQEPEIGTITISIFENGQPVIEGEAIFHAADGSYLFREGIGSDGIVEAEIPAGSMVTLAREWELSEVFMQTIMGLQPGDDLICGEPEPGVPFEEVGQISVTINDAVEDADYYLLSLGYSGFGSTDISAPIQGTIYRRDLTQSNHVNVVAIALQRDQRLAWSIATDVVVQEDSTTLVTMPGWNTTFSTFTANATNAPADARLFSLEFDVLYQGLSYDSADDAIAVTGGGPAAIILENLVTGVGDRFGYVAGIFFGEVDFRDGVSYLIRADPSKPDTVTLDLSSDMLPRVYDVALDTTDPVRPSITWSTAGDLAGADAVLMGVVWTDTDFVEHGWYVLAPPDTPSPLRLPELPENRASWRPSDTTTYDDLPWVGFVEADFIEGYDEARAGTKPVLVESASQVPAGRSWRVSMGGGDVF